MKTFLSILFTFLVHSAFSQEAGLYNRGAAITVKNNTKLYVNGSVVVSDFGNLKGGFFIGSTGDNSELLISKNLISTSEDTVFNKENVSKITFYGSENSVIESKKVIYCGDCQVNKQGAKVEIKNSLVVSKVNFKLTEGQVTLNNSQIQVLDGAKVVGENEQNFIYGDQKVFQKNVKFATANPQLGLVLTNNNVGVYDEVSRFNNVTVAGESSTDLIYKVTNALAVSGSTQATLSYRDALITGNLKEADLAVYYSNDSISWTKLTTTLKNTSGNTISCNLPDFNQIWLTLANEKCINKPALSISQSNILCEGQRSTLLASQTQGVFNWWNNSNASNILGIKRDFEIIDAGTFSVKYTDTKGCDTTASKIVQKGAPPIVNFRLENSSNNYGCSKSNLVFTDQSTVANSTISNYTWVTKQFKTVQTSQKITLNYPFYRLDTITHTVTSAFGCSQSITKTFAALDLPSVKSDFKKTYCSNENIILNDQSTINQMVGFPDAIDSVKWSLNNDFKTGKTNQNFSAKPTGKYVYRHEVKSSRGCKSVYNDTLVVKLAPQPNFNVGITCEKEVYNISSITPTTVVSKEWFLDGVKQTVSNDKIRAQDKNSHVLKLTVTDAFCKGEIEKSVQALETPIAAFELNDTCTGINEKTINKSTFSSGSLLFSWLADGKNLGVQKDIDLGWTTVGAHSVQLIAEGSNTCSDTLIKSIQSFVVPVALLEANNNCLNTTTKFINKSTAANSTLKYTQWFDNEFSKPGFQSEYTFLSAGKKQSVLKVTTEKGCVDFDTIQHEIFALPEFEMSDVRTCLNSYVIESPKKGSQFTNLWSNSLGVQSTGESISFSKNDNYTLKVTDLNQCFWEDDFSVELNIKDGKLNFFNDTTACDKLLLNVSQDKSTYLWSDGSTLATKEVVSSGEFSVSINTEDGCNYKDTIIIQIEKSPKLSIPSLYQSCIGTPVTVRANLIGGVLTWSNGVSGVSEQNISASQKLNLEATNPKGFCTVYDTTDVVFYANPVVDLGADRSACDTLILKHNVVADTVYWSNSKLDSLILTESSSPILIATNGGICTSKDTLKIEIIKSPELPEDKIYSVCQGNTVNVTIGPAEKVLWSDGATERIKTFLQPDTLAVTASNQFCSVTDTFRIRFTKLPSPNFGNDTARCGKDKVQLSFDFPGFVNNWYSEKDGLINQGKTLEIKTSDTYWLLSSDGGNCSVSDTIKMDILQDADARFLASSIGEINDTIQFVSVSELPSTEFFWEFGNGFESNLKSPKNQFFFPGEYQVQLIASLGSCKDTVTNIITIYDEGKSPIDLFIKDIKAILIESAEAFPNPFDEELKLTVSLSVKGEMTIHLIDAKGSIRLTKSYVAKELNESFETNDLETGTYTLFVVAGKNKRAFNLVKSSGQ